MNPLIHFTGGRKIMNMAKLGTVSAAMNHPAKPSKPINHGLYKVTRYTLCDIYTWMEWNEMLIKSNETIA
jgi:hypothetical protein